VASLDFTFRVGTWEADGECEGSTGVDVRPLTGNMVHNKFIDKTFL